MSRFINRVDGAGEASSAALKKQNAELVSVLRELVYGGGGHVWTHARELLAELDGDV